MKTIKIVWSKYFYKRMQIYILSIMFGLISMLAPLTDMRLLLAFISVGFWLLGVTYGRYWEIES